MRGAAIATAVALLTVHPLDDQDLGSPAPWTFLASTLQQVDVVSLPEPIHMTHELPLVRLGIVKSLNEHSSFHVLAMEGSMVDAWAAQDRFLASSRSDQDAAEAQLALFPLWNTPEIQQLFEYEAASWSTPAPLYVTAYDVQPGSGKGTHGVDAFRLLAERLATYAPPPSGFVLDTWLSDLQPLTGGCQDFSPAKAPAVVAAIAQLEQWIAAAGPAVAVRGPRVPMHAAALGLVPANLRGSLALCAGIASPAAKYKAVRDREGAVFAEALRHASPGAKLMLWAHWSHLRYVDPDTGVSVGQQLRQQLGTRLFTILPVAERGTVIAIFPNRASDEDVGFAWVRSGSDPFSARLRALSSSSFFLDLRDPRVARDEGFAGEQSLWVESRAVRIRLIESADAIVWLDHVSPPQLRLPLLLILGGMHYRVTLAVAASAAAGGVLALVVWRWRRRRRR
jgi:erythromycin esterase-like protein